MKSINDEYYCAGGHDPKDCLMHEVFGACEVTEETACSCKKRKFYTREQFFEDYGEEWKGAVYSHCTNDECTDDCKYKEWGDGEEYDCLLRALAVCACTPFGRPPDGWRPE
jgi:hypothetical protein